MMGIRYVILVLYGLLLTYSAIAIFCLILAFIMKTIFPLFMGIVAIEWPKWVIINADKYSSWYVFLLTVKLLIGTLIPIRPEIKQNNKASK